MTVDAMDDTALRTWVEAWFRALDRHADLDDVLGFVADDVELRLPEGIRRGRGGFADWYLEVTHRYFDEEHRVRRVDVRRSGDAVTLVVQVRWETRVWDPPAARCTSLCFDAAQTWRLVAGPDGRPRIRRYVVDLLVPVAPSAHL